MGEENLKPRYFNFSLSERARNTRNCASGFIYVVLQGYPGYIEELVTNVEFVIICLVHYYIIIVNYL